jgi:hypothetical protein
VARRTRLASLIPIPRARLFPCKCAVMASSKRARSVTLVLVTIRHAVIPRLASSGSEPFVTQAVRLAARVIASLPRERSYAGSPRMIGVMYPSFVLVTRQRVQRTSPSQTVRTSDSPIPIVLTPLQGQSCGTGELACADGVCTSLDCMFPSRCRNSLHQDTDCHSAQCQSAGSTLGLTKACSARNDKTCQVSCQDPRTANQCIVLQTQLVDGSPCGTCTFVYGDETVAEVGVADRLRRNVSERKLSKRLNLGYLYS